MQNKTITLSFLDEYTGKQTSLRIPCGKIAGTNFSIQVTSEYDPNLLTADKATTNILHTIAGLSNFLTEINSTSQRDVSLPSITKYFASSPITSSSINQQVGNSYTSNPIASSSLNQPLANTYTSNPIASSSINQPVANTYTSNPIASSSINHSLANTYISNPIASSSINQPIANTYSGGNQPLVNMLSIRQARDEFFDQPGANSSTQQRITSPTTNQPLTTTTTKKQKERKVVGSDHRIYGIIEDMKKYKADTDEGKQKLIELHTELKTYAQNNCIVIETKDEDNENIKLFLNTTNLNAIYNLLLNGGGVKNSESDHPSADYSKDFIFAPISSLTICKYE